MPFIFDPQQQKFQQEEQKQPGVNFGLQQAIQPGKIIAQLPASGGGGEGGGDEGFGEFLSGLAGAFKGMGGGGGANVGSVGASAGATAPVQGLQTQQPTSIMSQGTQVNNAITGNLSPGMRQNAVPIQRSSISAGGLGIGNNSQVATPQWESLSKTPAFQNGLQAHQKAFNAGVTKSPVMTVVDYSLPANQPRMFTVDTANKQILNATYVAQGETPGFSNKPGSHQSSLGTFLTSDIYTGKHGQSMRVQGLDKGINDKAMERAIVVHGGNYVGPDKAGNSWGCFTVPNQVAPKLIGMTKGGTIIHAYAPTPQAANNVVSNLTPQGQSAFHQSVQKNIQTTNAMQSQQAAQNAPQQALGGSPPQIPGSPQGAASSPSIGSQGIPDITGKPFQSQPGMNPLAPPSVDTLSQMKPPTALGQPSAPQPPSAAVQAQAQNIPYHPSLGAPVPPTPPQGMQVAQGSPVGNVPAASAPPAPAQYNPTGMQPPVRSDQQDIIHDIDAGRDDYAVKIGKDMGSLSAAINDKYPNVPGTPMQSSASGLPQQATQQANAPIAPVQQTRQQAQTMSSNEYLKDIETTQDYIRMREEYIPKAYWDVNAYRAGFGSDTYTTADGKVHKVTSSSRVTREDAERDLARRTNDFASNARKTVSPEAWDKLSPNTQAALTSIAYNYGSLTKLTGLRNAVKSGDPASIAAEVRKLGAHNNGVNRGRRNQEADMIEGKYVHKGSKWNPNKGNFNTAQGTAQGVTLDAPKGYGEPLKNPITFEESDIIANDGGGLEDSQGTGVYNTQPTIKDIVNQTVSGKLQNPADVAERYIGLTNGDPTSKEVLSDIFNKAVGTNKKLDITQVGYCGGFVNTILRQSGYAGMNTSITDAFRTYSSPTTTPQRGDVVLSDGHASFYEGQDPTNKDNIIVVGGNQGRPNNVSTGNQLGVNKISIPKSEVISYRQLPDSRGMKSITDKINEQFPVSAPNPDSYIPTTQPYSTPKENLFSKILSDKRFRR